MHPAMIQAELKIQGLTQRDISKQIGGVSDSAVHLVIQGRGRSKRIETRIAAVIGKPLADIWPQWYGPKAKRRRVRSA